MPIATGIEKDQQIIIREVANMVTCLLGKKTRSLPAGSPPINSRMQRRLLGPHSAAFVGRTIK
jgi:hypothetical protein